MSAVKAAAAAAIRASLLQRNNCFKEGPRAFSSRRANARVRHLQSTYQLPLIYEDMRAREHASLRSDCTLLTFQRLLSYIRRARGAVDAIHKEIPHEFFFRFFLLSSPLPFFLPAARCIAD